MVRYKYRTRYLQRAFPFTVLFPLFVGRLLRKGLKNKAYIIAIFCVGFAKSRLKKSGVIIFERAFRFLLPSLDLIRRIVSGRTYFLPCPIKMQRNIKIAVTWFLSCAKLSTDISSILSIRLGQLLIDTFLYKGIVIKKIQEHNQIIIKSRPLFSKRKFRVLVL